MMAVVTGLDNLLPSSSGLQLDDGFGYGPEVGDNVPSSSGLQLDDGGGYGLEGGDRTITQLDFSQTGDLGLGN